MSPFTTFSGTFYRAVFAHDLSGILAGAKHPEGRFHHSGQRALYLSPSVTAVGFAVDIYVRPEDPPRLIQPLVLRDAQMADLRRKDVCADLGLNGDETAVPWMPERAAGLPATTWRASDAVRASGADGMIFASRREPSRWHLVLFHWNEPGRAEVWLEGAPVPFPA